MTNLTLSLVTLAMVANPIEHNTKLLTLAYALIAPRGGFYTVENYY